MWRKKLRVCTTDLSTRKYLQDLHISSGYLKRRHRSLLALKPTHIVQSKSDGANTIGAREQWIGRIQSHELESNPNTSYAKTRPSCQKGLRSCRWGEERGPGRRRAGKAWRRRVQPWRRPSGSFSKLSLGAGSESRRRVRETCHSAETAELFFGVLSSRAS